MLETIREYARERLAACADAEAVARRYAAYYLALAEAAEPALRDGRQAAWGDQLEREYGNLRAALRWFIARGAAEQGLRMGGALWRFWGFHGHALEGRDLLVEVLALPGGSAAARATALLGAGWLADWQWDSNRATALCQDSAVLYRAAGDRWGLAFALSYVGYPISWSRERIAESAALFEQLGEPWGLALACILRGELAGHQGDLSGLALAQEGVRQFRAIGDRWFLLAVLERLRYIAHPYVIDDGTWMARLLDEYLQLAREVGDPEAIANALSVRAEEARWQATYGQAAALYDEAIARWTPSGSPWRWPRRCMGAGWWRIIRARVNGRTHSSPRACPCSTRRSMMGWGGASRGGPGSRRVRGMRDVPHGCWPQAMCCAISRRGRWGIPGAPNSTGSLRRHAANSTTRRGLRRGRRVGRCRWSRRSPTPMRAWIKMPSPIRRTRDRSTWAPQVERPTV